MTPKDAEGGAGEDTPNAASNSDEAAITQPVDADRSEQASPRQPHDVEGPTQLPLPGMGAPTEDDGWTTFEFAAAIEQCARQGIPFTSADVRKLVRGEPENPNLIGLQFAHAARHGVIVPLAAVQSSVPSRRRGLVRLWQGAAA